MIGTKILQPFQAKVEKIYSTEISFKFRAYNKKTLLQQLFHISPEYVH